jgi:hypothetical protein
MFSLPAISLALLVGACGMFLDDGNHINRTARIGTKKKIDGAFIITMCDETSADEDVDTFVADMASKDADSNRPNYKAKTKVRRIK